MAEAHRLRNAILGAREEVERLERQLERLRARDTVGLEMYEEVDHERQIGDAEKRLFAARRELALAESALTYAASTSERIRRDVVEVALMERIKPVQRLSGEVEAGISQLLDALALFNHQRGMVDEMLVEYKALTRHPRHEIEQLEAGLPRNTQNLTAQLLVELKKSGLLASIKTVSM